MTSQEFVYWLQGYLELSGAKKLDAKQIQAIREHIGLVLHKVTGPVQPAFFGGGMLLCSDGKTPASC